MPNLQVITVNETLVVDSRLVSEELGIEHATFIRTIRKYLTEIQDFGQLRFESATVTNSVGARNTVIFCYLNEDQATYVMTLSRNTDQVRRCKRNLVKAFSQAKQTIKTVIPQQQETIRELELRLALAQAEANSAIAQKQLLDTRHYITTALPEPVQQKILGYTEIVKEVVKEKVYRDDELIRDGSTITKTELCHRYGYVTKSGSPDYRTLNQYLSIAGVGTGFDKNGNNPYWTQTHQIRTGDEFKREHLAYLDRLLCSDRVGYQIHLGETP